MVKFEILSFEKVVAVLCVEELLELTWSFFDRADLGCWEQDLEMHSMPRQTAWSTCFLTASKGACSMLIKRGIQIEVNYR